MVMDVPGKRRRDRSRGERTGIIGRRGARAGSLKATSPKHRPPVKSEHLSIILLPSVLKPSSTLSRGMLADDG